MSNVLIALISWKRVKGDDRNILKCQNHIFLLLWMSTLRKELTRLLAKCENVNWTLPVLFVNHYETQSSMTRDFKKSVNIRAKWHPPCLTLWRPCVKTVWPHVSLELEIAPCISRQKYRYQIMYLAQHWTDSYFVY